MRLKSVLLVVFLLFSTGMLSAQGNAKAIQKLRELYNEHKYEKLEFKCYTLSANPEVKREPLLYLYWAKAQYEIYKKGDQEEVYPKADRDAIKYSIKFMTKDKKGIHWEEGKDFILEMEQILKDSAVALMADSNYRKAKTVFKNLSKLSKNNSAEAWFMKAVCEINMNLVNEARVSFEKGMGYDYGEEQFATLSDQHQTQLRTQFEAWFEANAEKTDGDANGTP